MKNNKTSSFLGAAFLLAATILVGDWFDRTPDHSTGEENLNGSVEIKDIEKIGDARLNRIITRLRQSEQGAALYDYALKNGVYIAWENEDDGAAGSYHNDENILTLDTRGNDNRLVSVLAHELRHHWQFAGTEINMMPLDPLRAWQVARLLEVDACAFTAKLITDHNATSAQKIDLDDKYGYKALAHYSSVPAAKRDYIKDAVMPCFDEISTNKNYNKNHAGFVQTLADIYEVRFVNATQSGDYSTVLAEIQQSPDDKSVKRYFSQLLSPTMDPHKPEPLIRDATDKEFVKWINTATTNEQMVDVLTLQKRYVENQIKVLERIQKSAGQPAPVPSS